MKENKLLLRFSLLFLLAGNLWDLIMTCYGLKKHAAGELNPLLSHLYSSYGIYYLILSKFSLVLIVSFVVVYSLQYACGRKMFIRAVDFIFFAFAGGIAFFCAGTSWLF